MSLLEVKGPSKSFGGLRAIHNLDLVVDEGEIVGIIGPNGSGKTTALNLVTDVTIGVDARTVRGRREIRGGYEVLEVPTPAVVSVRTACGEPRFMDFGIKRWAFEKGQVTVWAAQDLAADESMVGARGSPTVVSGLDEARVRERRREFLQGAPEEIARHLLKRLGRID